MAGTCTGKYCTHPEGERTTTPITCDTMLKLLHSRMNELAEKAGDILSFDGDGAETTNLAERLHAIMMHYRNKISNYLLGTTS